MKREYKIAVGIAASAAAIIAGLIWIFRRRDFFPFPAHELYAANVLNHSIVGFELDRQGVATPSPGRIIMGPHTGLQNPFDVALDRNNRIWVLNLGPRPGGTGNQPTITVYDPDANGDAAPVITFSQIVRPSGFTLAMERPGAIAIRPISQNILVADGNGRVIELLPDFSNFGILTGGQDQFVSPTGIATDVIGRIFVAHPSNNAILIFLFLSSNPFSQDPVATIIGEDTLLDNPAHIALDQQGFLYVLNRGTNPPDTVNITIYEPGANGNFPPVRRIGYHGTPFTPLGPAYGIAVDQGGRIFVSSGNSILQFSPQASGNVVLEQTIIHSEQSSLLVGLAVR